MSSFTKIKYEKKLGKIGCNICNKILSRDSIIFIPDDYFGYICERCYIIFSADDIEEFLVLFDKYGGFFGQLKTNKIPLDQLIEEIFELLNYKNNVDIIEANMKLRHKALLYGYTSQQLIDEMKEQIH